MARVKIIKEVRLGTPDDWQLYFQWCQYLYDNNSNEYGYRFIWRREDGSLQPARGQARIPSVDDIEKLMELADKEGWLKNIEKL